jgi:hypothetical protein
MNQHVAKRDCLPFRRKAASVVNRRTFLWMGIEDSKRALIERLLALSNSQIVYIYFQIIASNSGDQLSWQGFLLR